MPARWAFSPTRRAGDGAGGVQAGDRRCGRARHLCQDLTAVDVSQLARSNHHSQDVDQRRDNRRHLGARREQDRDAMGPGRRSKAPHPEYPRPQLVRPEWAPLNGLWDYAFVPMGSPAPATWDGKILVPFAVESALSGVGRSPMPTEAIVYHRTFDVPKEWLIGTSCSASVRWTTRRRYRSIISKSDSTKAATTASRST